MLQLDEVLCKFDLSAERLQDSYNQLQQEIGSLNLELEEKNEQHGQDRGGSCQADGTG